MVTVSQHAQISPRAKLGNRVSVGAFTIIHDDVVVGDDSIIESHCILGHPTPLAQGKPLIVGADAHIRSHSIFYQGSVFGPGLRTGHRVTVREHFQAGKQLQIGSQCDFQGQTVVGDHVRTHSNVFVAPNTRIGNCVWLFPHVVITNDPHPPSDGFFAGATIEDYAAVAAMACLLPGVNIGARSLVAARSLVTRDVPADMAVAGSPARVIGPAATIPLKDGSGPAYPWTRHFHRGYPDDLVAQWMEAEARSMAAGD